MGREARRVPMDWQHPKKDGSYIPLYEGENLHSRAQAWHESNALWLEGKHPDQTRFPNHRSETWADWHGDCPDPANYMPNWPEAERTHWQMYETCSEGTPISGTFETPEDLARWLTDNEASAFAHMTASYDGWLATIIGGGSIGSCVIGPSGMITGVEATTRGRKGKEGDPTP